MSNQNLRMEYFETVDYFMVHLCVCVCETVFENGQIYVISRVHDDVAVSAINMLEIEWPTTDTNKSFDSSLRYRLEW